MEEELENGREEGEGGIGEEKEKGEKDAPVNKNNKNNTNGNGSTPIRKSSQKLPKQTWSISSERKSSPL